MKTDEAKLVEVEHELEQATSGAEIVRLRARRDMLEERIGWSTPHRFDPVKHPRARGKFASKGGPDDPIMFALNKRDRQRTGKMDPVVFAHTPESQGGGMKQSFVYGHPVGTSVIHNGAEHVIERNSQKTTQKSVRLRPVAGGPSVEVDPGTVVSHADPIVAAHSPEYLASLKKKK